ncbi:hypothetical protein, partial [Rhizobium sp. RU36D]|uniref:hypothetical protein n=1 Tax=Rhizobium sp. RU36D TaxID=1907415 RepID=UPI001AEC82A5
TPWRNSLSLIHGMFDHRSGDGGQCGGRTPVTMQLNWLLMFDALTRENRRRRHPLSDPLEAAEWQGSEWIIRLSAWFLRENRQDRERRAKTDRRVHERRYAAPSP